MFLSLVLQDYRIPVCAQLLVMIVIAGRLLLLGFVFKPVSWLAGDNRLRQTFSLRIHLVERQSLSPGSSICPSTIISYLRSLEASLSTSASRPIAGPIVFSLDRNKPVTHLDRGFFASLLWVISYVYLFLGKDKTFVLIAFVPSSTVLVAFPLLLLISVRYWY